MSEQNINRACHADNSASPGTYVPRYAKSKLLMVLGGFILFVLGFSQIWTPLRLVLFGCPVRAEIAAVVKTQEGLPDVLLTDALQVQAQCETQDRNYIFWNIFRFRTGDGTLVEVRAPVGGRLKLLYSLTDADGLPTTDILYYNPGHPENVVFPLIASTWFAPGILIMAGLAAMLIGGTLYYWAYRPIELPHFSVGES